VRAPGSAGRDRPHLRTQGVGALLAGGETTADDLHELEGKLFYDTEPGIDPYVRFGVLLVASVVIATGGVLSDATATVVGAMIVAPLMVPILAAALAIVTGDLVRMWRSLAVVAVGVLVAVALSALLGWLTPGVVQVRGNSQIEGRITPALIDLVVALASGGVGAFAMGRRSVADALPGVAIAISLVPPLCVVGICLAVGEMSAAWGAALLFTTNLLAILAAGGTVLAVMGFGRVGGRDARHRRRAALTVAIATVALLVPLGAASFRVARDSWIEHTTMQAAEAWLEDLDAELLGVDARGDRVEVVVDGPRPLPPIDDLADDVWDHHPSVVVRVRHLLGDQVVADPAGRSG
jgi:uncharacterized hydrophobic protein (TIGR00271 family)